MDQVAVETESYRAGAVPPWNILVKNPIYARAYANRIAEFSAAYEVSRFPSTANAELRKLYSLRFHLLAHSNGTNIAVGAVKRLAKLGIRVETLILVGSAVHSDVERNGLAELIGGDHLRRVIAYCGESDKVIRHLQSFPGFYGSLGTRGFERDGRRTGLQVEGFQPLTEKDWGHDRHRFITRTFPGFTHSQWMSPEHREEAFQSFARDMALPLMAEGSCGEDE